MGNIDWSGLILATSRYPGLTRSNRFNTEGTEKEELFRETGVNSVQS